MLKPKRPPFSHSLACPELHERRGRWIDRRERADVGQREVNVGEQGKSGGRNGDEDAEETSQCSVSDHDLDARTGLRLGARL